MTETTMTDTALPLQGVKVLDLSRILAAPISTQILGDLGADVIKVERPGIGDESRIYGPSFLRDPKGEGAPQSAFYLSANRNKRSLTINIASPEGQELVRKLAATSDVVFENYRVGTLKRYGLDYESLAAVNPRLVYCSITAFGQSGPYAARPGYDGIFQAAGGLMSVTGIPDGQPGAGPMKVGPSIADVMTGYNAAIGVLAALRHRDHVSGRGQHIDLALFDTVVAAASHYTMEYLVSGTPPKRKGTEGNGGMPAGVYRCLDRDIYLAVGNDEQYRRFCEIIGHPELAVDPAYSTVIARSDNRRSLVATLEPILAQWSAPALIEQLEEAGVPCSFVNDYEQVFADPQAIHRGLGVVSPHPYEPQQRFVANPLRFSETKVETYERPPFLGEHTDAILTEELGLSGEEIERLRADGII